MKNISVFSLVDEITIVIPHGTKTTQVYTIPGIREQITRYSDGIHFSAPKTSATLEKLFAAYPAKSMRVDGVLAELIDSPTAPRNVFLEELPAIPVTYCDPWLHQVQAYHFAMDRDGTLFDICCGGGKTKIALDLAINFPALRTLVICPKAVVDNWPIETAIHWPNEHARKVCAARVHKTTIKDRVAYVSEVIRTTPADIPLIVIVSHDTAKDPAMLALLTSGMWDLAIMDESHKIKDPATALAKACYQIRDHATKRIALSGTAFGQQPLDIFGQVLFVDKTIFPMNPWQFKKKYAKYDDSKFPKIIGVINEEDFNRRLARVVFHVDKAVLDTLPVTHTNRYFDLAPKARKIYRDLDKDLSATLGSSRVAAVNGAVKLQKLLEISSGFVIDEFGKEIEIDTGKQEAFESLLDEIGRGIPIAVFALFTHDLYAIKVSCMRAGLTYAELSGKRNQLEEFQAGHADVIGVQVQSGGAGVNLTRAAHGIYYSCGHAVIDYEQTHARLDRPGQKSHVKFHYLIANDSRDEAVYDALRAKKDVIEAIREASQAVALVS